MDANISRHYAIGIRLVVQENLNHSVNKDTDFVSNRRIVSKKQYFISDFEKINEEAEM